MRLVQDDLTNHKADLRSAIIGQFRIFALAGVLVGVVVIGFGGRVAMFILRLTSPDSVIGVQSGDGFEIGRFTFKETYGLLNLGALFGVFGACVYQLVEKRLIGPMWFRRMTVGLAAGVVVGSMLIDPGGVDFVLLKPAWLAVLLTSLWPALFGLTIAWAVDKVGAWNRTGPGGLAAWVIPIFAVLAFPVSLFMVGLGLIVFWTWTAVVDVTDMQLLLSNRRFGLAVQGLWLLAATAGLVALIGDIRAVS